MSWSYSNAPEEGVEVTSWKKLKGFAPYLYREEHTKYGVSYWYSIPVELKAKAIKAGGTISEGCYGKRKTDGDS